MKAKIVQKRTIAFFSILAVVMYSLVCLLVLNDGLSFNYGVILIIFALLVFLVGMRILFALVIIAGFLLRFSFMAFQDHFYIDSTLSDTGVHWYGAQQIVESGGLDQEVGEYEKLYPYLFSYTSSLSAIMSVFGESYTSVVLLNVLCDLVSCALLYLLFRFWKNDNDVGLLAATLWAINPLQVAFCGLPLAIVVVNTLIIVAITLLYFSFRYCDSIKKTIVFSLLAGIVLAIGNAFRPIFLVFLLAYLLFCFIYSLKEKKRIKNMVIGCVIIIIGYLATSIVPGLWHQHFNPYFNGEKSRVGWSVYVGANYETGGAWSREDSYYFFGPVLVDRANNDVEVASSIIFGEAMGRYKDMVLNWQLVPHFFNKTTVLFGDVENSAYDLQYVYGFSKGETVYELLQDMMLVFYYCVLFALGWYLVKRAKDGLNGQEDMFRLYLIIALLGLFAASMLVEVMNRYSLPFITIMLILAVGLLCEGKKKNKV